MAEPGVGAASLEPAGLWDERVAAGDVVVRQLKEARHTLVHQLSDPRALIKEAINRALAQCSRLDRHFWLTTAAEVIADQQPSTHQALFRLASQRIAANYAVARRDRDAAIRFLAAEVKPLR